MLLSALCWYSLVFLLFLSFLRYPPHLTCHLLKYPFIISLSGGFALHNPQEEASLKVSCFVLDPTLESYDGPDFPDGQAGWLGDNLRIRDEKRSEKYPHLSRSFTDFIDTFGPNDFFVLQKSLKEDMPRYLIDFTVPLPYLLSHIHMSNLNYI